MEKLPTLEEDHGTRQQVAVDNKWVGEDGNILLVETEKEYWRTWEHACPYVRNNQCCDISKDECCTGASTDTTTTIAPPTDTTTTASTTSTTTSTITSTTTAPNNNAGGGGDPHFQRWGQEHDSFHGECDIVMVHSENFHGGIGFDLHARTTIQDYFSYIETMAMRVGDDRLEFYKDHFYLNDMKLTPADLPLKFGDGKYTIENGILGHGKNAKYHQYYKVDLHQSSWVLFKFYKKFLTFEISGHPVDFSDSVGLMGEFHTGNMISRDGEPMDQFSECGFEWQVSPDQDVTLFREARSPQLPYERCRMPTASRPDRRHLRSDGALLAEAQAACAHVPGNGRDLCVDDVLQTGDVGLAGLW